MKPQPRRRSIRLPGYDYSQPGAYFVTVCTRNRECVFWETTKGAVCLSALGEIAAGCLADLPSHFQDVELDKWVVMPNHIHAILVLACSGRGVQLNAPTASTGLAHDRRGPTLPSLSPGKGTFAVVVRTYKAAVTTLARRNHLADAVWQRNYYEHVIRTEAELQAIREYIAQNPLAWEHDEENPGRVS